MYLQIVHRVYWIDIYTENTLICSLLNSEEYRYFQPSSPNSFHIRSIGIRDAYWRCNLDWGFNLPVSQISCMHSVYTARMAKISMMGLKYHSVDHFTESQSNYSPHQTQFHLKTTRFSTFSFTVYRKDSAISRFDYKTGELFWPIIWRLLHRLIYKTGQIFRRLLWVPRFITNIDDRELSPKSTLHEIWIIKETQYARETCHFYLPKVFNASYLLTFLVTWRKIFSGWRHICCLHEGR